jgi:hypothetical protein
VVTLDISSNAIRLMEVSGRKIVRWASHALEPGMFQEEIVSDPRALGVAVKQLMTSSGIKGAEVTASVSGLHSLSRIVTVPATTEKSVLQQAVLEKAGETMPLSEDELYLSWQTIGAGEEGQQVMVVGVPKDVIDNEVRALRAAGLNPRILGLKPMALARAANRKRALILNIEPTSFDIIMIVNDVAEVMHTRAWQPEGLSVEERAEDLILALEMTVGFYDSDHADSPLDPTTPLFITGQMSGDLALIEKLQAVVEYPIESLAPPLEYPEYLPVSQYAVNIGLALRRRAASKNVGESGHSLTDMNLLPQVYRPWRPSTRQMEFFCGVVLAIALLFPLWGATSKAMGETSILQSRYSILNSQMQRRQLEIKNLDPLLKAIADYTTIVNMRRDFTEDLRTIDALAEKLGVELHSINYAGSTVTVACQAKDYTVFRAYVVALEQSGRFAAPVTPPEDYPYVTGGNILLKPKSGK